MSRYDMTPDEARAFIQDGTRTGKLATTKQDGSPHVVPIWFVLDDDDLVFTTWHTSAKAGNLRRDARASLCIDDQTPPYSFVTVFGSVTFSNDMDELRTFATKIGKRYMGADRADEFGNRNAVDGELVVRLHIEHMVAHKDVSD